MPNSFSGKPEISKSKFWGNFLMSTFLHNFVVKICGIRIWIGIWMIHGDSGQITKNFPILEVTPGFWGWCESSQFRLELRGRAPWSSARPIIWVKNMKTNIDSHMKYIMSSQKIWVFYPPFLTSMLSTLFLGDFCGNLGAIFSHRQTAEYTTPTWFLWPPTQCSVSPILTSHFDLFRNNPV